jgi:hypothetical protein
MMSFSLGSVASAVASAALPAFSDSAMPDPAPIKALSPNPPPIKADALMPTPPPITPNPLTSYVPPGGLHPVASGTAVAQIDGESQTGGHHDFIEVLKYPEGGGISGLLHTVANLARSGGSPG